MRIRWIAALLCVVLIATFVDTIPDPPALTPPRIEHHVAPRIALDLAANAALQWYRFLFGLLFLQISFAVLWFFKPRDLLRNLALIVHHAADVSPPLVF